MLTVTVFLLIFGFSHGAKILGVFPEPSISHQAVYQPIWRELSLRGHQVTVFTPRPLKDPKLVNLTEIDMSSRYHSINMDEFVKNMSKDRYLINLVFYVGNMIFTFTEEHLKAATELLEDANFDLILVETLGPLVYSFGCRFKVPMVGISSLGVLLHSHDAVGNPTHPVLNPDFFLDFEKGMGFYEKIISTLYNVWFRLLHHWYFLPKGDEITKKYFGRDCPYLGDILRNVSLLLTNTNPILHPIRPNVPALVEMGQMHINAKKPLPKDLQDYLDGSDRGVVYFSLGSNVKSSNLPEDVRKVIIEALSELPYNVLWKWETDHLPYQPKNVMIKKWLPQQDLLGHKNIKAFVTQGGLQSVEEAITYGVPVVGMAFFGDQPLNVMKMVNLGIALSVDYNTMTSEILKKAIVEVVENEKYREKVNEIRVLLADQPMNGLEKAIWWIEYVIRNNGARHLRSPAVDMPFYEYYLIDVIAGLWISVFAVTYLLHLSVKMILNVIVKNKNKIKIN